MITKMMHKMQINESIYAWYHKDQTLLKKHFSFPLTMSLRTSPIRDELSLDIAWSQIIASFTDK